MGINGGRILYEETPEGRLAAVAVLVATEFEDRYAKTGVGPRQPDVADFREAFQPYIEDLLLRARIDESEQTIDMKSNRRQDLVRRLYECQLRIPWDHRL